MTRFVIALFSQSFPRPFPPSWRSKWQAHVARWLSGLLASYLFLLPWFVVTRWADGAELPKALLSLSAFSVWLVLRSTYSLLKGPIIEGEIVTAASPHWSAFSLWMGVLGLAASGAWFFSPHLAISWVGNGAQISTSFAMFLLGLWLVIAIRDAVQRDGLVRRLFLRSWLLGVAVALVSALILRGAGSLDVFLFLPIALFVGLMLLATRSKVSEPLTAQKLFLYRASHAVLALLLVGGLALGLIVQLGVLWNLVFSSSLIIGIVVAVKQRAISLAGFVSLLAIVCSLVGLAEFAGKLAMPDWVGVQRQAWHVHQLTEILPTQTVSWQVVRDAIKRAPLFGAGPGSWISAFDQARPLGLNQTLLWDARFPRGASAVGMGLAEYGLVTSALLALFFLVLLTRAIKIAHQTRNAPLFLQTLLIVLSLAFLSLRPATVLSVLSLAMFTGLLSAEVFGRASSSPKWFTQVRSRPFLIGASVIAAILVLVFVLQRAAAAELLRSAEPYALPLARRLNGADDTTFAQEAAFYLNQAQALANGPRAQLVPLVLDRAEQAINQALARNPRDPEHVSFALQIASLRASVDERAEESVLALAQELNELRPTDPNAPLAVFGVQRQRALREARWVEQGQGRDKEEAMQREAQASQLAEQALQEALRRKSDYVPALYAQAAWFAQSGKAIEAIQSLEQLSLQQPASPDIQLPLALLYRRTDQPQKAVDVLQRLVKAVPGVLDYQWQLSLALVQAERLEEATTVLQRLAAEAPQEASYQTQLKEVLRRRAEALTPPAPIIATSTTSTAPTSTKSTVRKPVRRKVTPVK